MKSSSSPENDGLIVVPIELLNPHPANSNSMQPESFKKLTENIRRSGKYPPVVVRSDRKRGRYQILDGHNRVNALRELGHETVNCFDWPCDDGQALLLLATLNRLEGQDIPSKRAELLGELTELMPAEDLALLLPESASQINETLELLELDIDRLLSDIESATARSSSDQPRLISFLVDREDEQDILNALDKRAATLSGKNRRGRALGQLCRQDGGAHDA